MLPSLAMGQQGQVDERCTALVLRQLPCSSAVPTLGMTISPCSDKGCLHEQVCLSFLPWGWVFLLLSGEQGALASGPILTWDGSGSPVVTCAGARSHSAKPDLCFAPLCPAALREPEVNKGQ